MNQILKSLSIASVLLFPVIFLLIGTVIEILILRRGWTGKKTAIVIPALSNFLGLITFVVLATVGFGILMYGMARTDMEGDTMGLVFMFAGLSSPFVGLVLVFIYRLAALRYIKLDGNELTWKYALGSTIITYLWFMSGVVLTFVLPVYLTPV